MPEKNYDNNQIIEKFLNNCIATGLGELRIKKYKQELGWLSSALEGNFDKATREDIERLVVKINQNKKWSEYTKYDYKVAIKKFYKWFNGGEECSPIAKWIPTKISKCKQKLPDDLLTEEEVKKMVEFAPTIRDKAFVITLYETGCRNGEMLSLKIKNVSFESQGTILRVHGKTGDRRVMTIMATPYLRDWMNNHPEKDNPNASLWIMLDGKALTQAGSSAMLKRIARKAKIKKKVNPHNFRHTRATHLANYLTEAQMKEYLGWTQSSDMASVYVHLSGRDTDNAILEMHGLKKEDKKKSQKLKPQKCMRCGDINKSTSKFCDKCGAILDLKTAVEFEKQRKDEKDILHLFVQKIVEKNPKQSIKILEEFPKGMLERLKDL
jgi:integrase/recombinase XerD